MKFELPGGSIAGYFVLSTDKRGVIAEFPNLITNLGLNYFYTYGFNLSYCYVGSGNTPPSFADADLNNFIGETWTNYASSTVSNTSTPPYISTKNYFYEFPVGVATGNLSEIGMGWKNSGVRKLFSRALILDAQGLPTTITVLPTEILRVTYILKLYIPDTDVSGSLTLSGNVGGTHTWTARAARVTESFSWTAGVGLTPWFTYRATVNDSPNPTVFAYASSMGGVTSAPAGTGIACNAGEGNTTAATWSVHAGSISVRSLLIGNYTFGRFQVEFNPPIQKTSLQQLTIGWGPPSVGRYSGT